MVNLNRLAGKMRECRLSQAQLGEAIGLSANSISNKMCGKSDFTVKQAIKVSKVLRLTDDELLEIFFCQQVV